MLATTHPSVKPRIKMKRLTYQRSLYQRRKRWLALLRVAPGRSKTYWQQNRRSDKNWTSTSNFMPTSRPMCYAGGAHTGWSCRTWPAWPSLYWPATQPVLHRNGYSVYLVILWARNEMLSSPQWFTRLCSWFLLENKFYSLLKAIQPLWRTVSFYLVNR